MDTNNVFEEEDGIVDVSYSVEIPKYILKEGGKLWSCSASAIPERDRCRYWDRRMQRGSASLRLTGSNDVDQYAISIHSQHKSEREAAFHHEAACPQIRIVRSFSPTAPTREAIRDDGPPENHVRMVRALATIGEGAVKAVTRNQAKSNQLPVVHSDSDRDTESQQSLNSLPVEPQAEPAENDRDSDDPRS